MATWRAARYGLDGDLVDVIGERSVPGPEMLDTLLGFIRPTLEEHDEWDMIRSLVQQVVQRGTGAARQRRALERRGRLEDVVDRTLRSPNGQADRAHENRPSLRRDVSLQIDW